MKTITMNDQSSKSKSGKHVYVYLRVATKEQLDSCTGQMQRYLDCISENAEMELKEKNIHENNNND